MNTLLNLWNAPQSDPWFTLSSPSPIERFLGTFGLPEDHSSQVLRPAYSAEETDTHYLITVDIPGVKKDDIHLDLAGDQLVIQAKRARDEKREGKGYWHEERSYGTQQRVFTLPNASSSEKVEAIYKDGVLRVAVPKTEEVKPKRISISSEDTSGFFGKLISGKKKEEKVVA